MIRVNLFTSNFRKMLKRLGTVGIGVAICVALIKLLNFIYVQEDEFSRMVMHYFYEEEDNIDYLYIGSSHVYCDLNPYILDELNGGNNFNLATPYQSPKTSYHLLKEADKYHDLQHVYVEVYYNMYIGDRGRYKNYAIDAWRCTDYMENSLNRLQFMVTMTNQDKYIETFMPFIRFRSKLFDMDHIQQQIATKVGQQYKCYTFKCENEREILEYLPKGYSATTLELQKNDLKRDYGYVIEKSPLPQETYDVLIQIIEYCQKEDIELTLFSSPVYELQLLSTEGYDNYVQQIEKIAEEYNIEYYDFNLCKGSHFQIQQRNYFRDEGHLNTKGTDIYTKFFYQIMQESPKKNTEYFYDSYEEKTIKEPNCVYGIYFVEEYDKEYSLWKVAGVGEKNEYRISITPQGGEAIMIQDFSENPYFKLKREEQGICTIVAREKGKEEVTTLEIEY